MRPPLFLRLRSCLLFGYDPIALTLWRALPFAYEIEHTSSHLAILDDDKSVQSALQDLIESEGMFALCFDFAEQFLDSGAKHKTDA